MALWEGGHPYRLDPATLDTVGSYSYGGQLRFFDTLCAHGKIDPRTGRYYSFGVRLTSRGFVTKLYEVSPQGFLVRRGEFRVGAHPFVHDFALTDKRMVFFVSPLAMKGLIPHALGLTTFDPALAYVPEEGLRIVIVRLVDFVVERTIDIEPFFVAHFGNAWEEGDDLVVDLVRFEDFGVDNAMRDILHSRGHQGGRLSGGSCGAPPVVDARTLARKRGACAHGLQTPSPLPRPRPNATSVRA